MNKIKKDVLFMIVRGNEKNVKVAKAKETFKEIYEDGLLIELIKTLNWSFLQATPQVTFEQREREAKWIALLADQTLGKEDKAFIDKKWKETEWSLKRHKTKEKFKKTLEIYANELNLEKAKMWLEELTKNEKEKQELEETPKGTEKLKYINRKTDTEIILHMKEWERYEMNTVKKLTEEMIKRNYRIHHQETKLPKEVVLEVQVDMYKKGRLKEFQNVLGLEYTKDYMELFTTKKIEISDTAKEQIQVWAKYSNQSMGEKHHYSEMLELKELEERASLLVRLHELNAKEVMVVDEEYKKVARENRIVLSNGRLIFSEDEEVFKWNLKDTALKTLEIISLKLRQGKKVFQKNENLKNFIQMIEQFYHNDVDKIRTLKEKLLGINLYMEVLGIKEATEWNKEKEKYDWLEYHRVIKELPEEEYLIEIEKNICEKYQLETTGKEVLKFLQSDWVSPQNRFAFVEKYQGEVVKEIEDYLQEKGDYKIFEMVNNYVYEA